MADGLFDAPPPTSPTSPEAPPGPTSPADGGPDPSSGWRASDRTGEDPPSPGAERPEHGATQPETEPEVPGPVADRRCARPTCSRRAAATMTYDYGSRTVWLDGMSSAPLPQGYDLCAEHADRLRVPEGWTATDSRPTYLASRLAG